MPSSTASSAHAAHRQSIPHASSYASASSVTGHSASAAASAAQSRGHREGGGGGGRNTALCAWEDPASHYGRLLHVARVQYWILGLIRRGEGRPLCRCAAAAAASASTSSNAASSATQSPAATGGDDRYYVATSTGGLEPLRSRQPPQLLHAASRAPSSTANGSTRPPRLAQKCPTCNSGGSGSHCGMPTHASGLSRFTASAFNVLTMALEMIGPRAAALCTRVLRECLHTDALVGFAGGE